MDLALFDFRRLLQPPLVVEPEHVELDDSWHEFEKDLSEFKTKYHAERVELSKLLGMLTKHRDELNMIKHTINSIYNQDTIDLLKEVYNKRSEDSNIEEIEQNAAIVCGKVRAMKKILHDTNAEKFNRFLCSICMDNMVDTFLDPCGHVFCEHCLVKTINRTNCPGCRALINQPKKIYTI